MSRVARRRPEPWPPRRRCRGPRPHLASPAGPRAGGRRLRSRGGPTVDHRGSRDVQLLRRHVHAPTTECCWRVYHRVDPGGTGVEGKPEPPERPRLDPRRRTTPVLGGQVLRQCREEHIPALVTGRSWFLVQQTGAHLGRFPAVLLKELRHQPLPSRFVGSNEQSTQARHRQWLVPRSAVPHPLTLVHTEADPWPAAARNEQPRRPSRSVAAGRFTWKINKVGRQGLEP